MAKSALIIGGTGQIGRACAHALLTCGWRVRVMSRHLAEPALADVEHLTLDRDEAGAVETAIRGGVDAVIDVAAYSERHARQLLGVERDVGAFVVISSASVYKDTHGRTLDEARASGFPDLPVPIPELHPTVDAGDQTYSTRKVALEQALVQSANRPFTILRPGAVHGAESRHCREWFFVKRILDGRCMVPLPYGGESRFHTAAAVNIAELIVVALRSPQTCILNIADPDSPSATVIGLTIAGVYDREIEIVPFPGAPRSNVGGHPWCIPRPIILDTGQAGAIGYRPAATYAQAVGSACRSAERAMAAGAVQPDYLRALFDYGAEDAWLARRRQ